MATPPATGILLRRRVRSLVSPPDQYAVNEDYYDPATRTAANYILDGSSADGSTYSRPATDIIDRWCLAPGAAPYTERQVRHHYASATALVGAGTVDFTDVDNVATCQITCTLTLTLDVSAVAGGRADVTATAAGAQSAVVFSIDDFQTGEKVPPVGTPFVYGFQNLRMGTYTVRVRETRPNGCSAAQTVVIRAPYGPRYRLNLFDLDSTPCEMTIWQREYGGAVEDLSYAQSNAVTLDYPGAATGHVFTQLLQGSQCQLALYLSRDEQLLPLFSGDERLHRVDYRRAGALAWTGFLLPEQYAVAFLAPPTTFDLSATDGLGTLMDVPFRGSAGELLTGDWSLRRIVQFCLAKLDLGLPLNVLYTLLPATARAGVPALDQTLFAVGGYTDAKGKTQSCGAVLTAILTALQARLYQQAGAWWLERLSELQAGPLRYEVFPADGPRAADLTRTALLSVNAPAAGRPHWFDANQQQGLRPAVATVTATVEDDALGNALAPVLPDNTDLPAVLAPGWTGFSAQPDPYTLLQYVGKGKTPALRLLGRTANATNQLLAPYVQTPVLPGQVVNRTSTYGQQAAGFLVLRFKATPYNNTPDTDLTRVSVLGVALQFGNVWLRASGDNVVTLFTNPFDTDSPTPLLGRVGFFNTKPVDVLARWSATTLLGPQPISLRFYAPVGGATPCTVDLTDLELVWYGEDGTQTGYQLEPTSEYTLNTNQLVSRVDTATKLFHSTTASPAFTARRTGTLLDYEGVPVAGFSEPATPGQFRELGDYFVRDRALFEARPAPVLTGLLRGHLPAGLGTLLTDPTEVRPAVYALVSATHDGPSATWRVTAVALNTLRAPSAAFPANVIYYDDLAAWADEDGRLLLYDFV